MQATAQRLAGFGREIWVRPAPPWPAEHAVALLRGDNYLCLQPRPDTAPAPFFGPTPTNFAAMPTLAAGDRLIVAVDHGQLADYCTWLAGISADAPSGWSLCPYTHQDGGLWRLQIIACARLALPLGVRVEVRHDLHGVRLAQLALGFGADTLGGPHDAGRHLPLAGVPRPSETSTLALAELVRQAGGLPVTDPPSPSQPLAKA